MCIKNFLDKYGTRTTSNFDLLRWGSQLGIKPFKVLMRNELSKLVKAQEKNKNVFIICNYQTTNDNGTHWVAMYDQFYFDSYGLQPFPEAVNYIQDGIYSTFRIQPEGTQMCGQLCLYVLYKLHQGDNFYDTILELNDYFNNKIK